MSHQTKENAKHGNRSHRKKPAFTAAGRKAWISGQDNEQFSRLWDVAHRDGLGDSLHAMNGGMAGTVTGSTAFGVSCVENDPDKRAFDFFIAAEAAGEVPQGLETHEIPACTWAIFEGRGELPMSLVNAEMFCFMEWLPKSGCRHAAAPELEVYPARDGELVEFWLPIVEK